MEKDGESEVPKEMQRKFESELEKELERKDEEGEEVEETKIDLDTILKTGSNDNNEMEEAIDFLKEMKEAQREILNNTDKENDSNNKDILNTDEDNDKEKDNSACNNFLLLFDQQNKRLRELLEEEEIKEDEYFKEARMKWDNFEPSFSDPGESVKVEVKGEVGVGVEVGVDLKVDSDSLLAGKMDLTEDGEEVRVVEPLDPCFNNLDDILLEEIEEYLLSEEETKIKSHIWMEDNREWYLEYEERKRLEEENPELARKRKRSQTSKRKKKAKSGEDVAVNVLKENKRMSSKINYKNLENLFKSNGEMEENN